MMALFWLVIENHHRALMWRDIQENREILLNELKGGDLWFLGHINSTRILVKVILASRIHVRTIGERKRILWWNRMKILIFLKIWLKTQIYSWIFYFYACWSGIECYRMNMIVFIMCTIQISISYPRSIDKKQEF